MNDLYRIIFALVIFLLVAFLNESAITLFRLKNPKTRFWIYIISFLASFSIFLFIPLKYMDLVIIFDKASFENKIYTIKPDSIALTSRWTAFAQVSFVLALLALLSFFLIITLNSIMVEKKWKLKKCRSRKVSDIVSSLEKEFGLRISKVSVFSGNTNTFVYGIPPAIAISEKLVRKLTTDELRIVLRHEFCHVKNKDTLLKPFLLSLCFFFFYNPAIYFIYKRIMEQREYIADKMAISTTQDKRVFLSLLLKVNGHSVPASCGFMSKTSRRVEMLFSEERHRWLPLLLSLMLTTSILGTCHLYLKTQQTSALNIPAITSMNYYSTVFKNNILEEKMKKKEKLEFFISEDASIIEALESASENERRIVIREWEYTNPYNVSRLRFVLDYDTDGNPLLQLVEVVESTPVTWVVGHHEIP
jgi:beta-lactamase regulating signal transducer with metallopeptidase domain